LVFLLVPIAELFLLIEVGSHIGGLSTIALVLLTAMVGLVTLRSQGFLTMLRARERMMQGEMPGRELLEGFLIAIGAIMLMVPGFITDTASLLFLLPWPRKWLAARLIRSGGLHMVAKGQTGFTWSRFGGVRRPGQSDAQDIYEGEFTRETPPRKALD